MTNQAKKKIEELTIKEALAWSDKHRKLSDNEGVRVIHIQQLLKRFASSQLSDLRREIEGMKGAVIKGTGAKWIVEDYIKRSEVLSLLDKKAGKK